MLKYFIEIKNRFLLLCLTFVSCLIITYLYKEILIFLMIQSKDKFDPTIFTYFIFTDVTEIFNIYIKLVFFMSVQIILLYLCYHTFIFFVPALYKKEYAFLNLFIKLCYFTWLISSWISIKILIPLTWNFFLSFQELITKTTLLDIYFEAKLIEYFQFYIYLYFLSILYFQIGIILLIIFNYSNITLYHIKKFRKIYYFSFIITSTLLTPDILSQCILGCIMIISYELFILIFLFYKKLYFLISKVTH